MKSFVACLRGVNVGGANRLAKTDLLAAFSGAGAKNVETYIQSGNVVFHADDGAKVARESERLLATKFAIGAAVAVVEAEKLARIITANPFLAQGEDPAKLHLVLFCGPVAVEGFKALDPARSPPDAFAVGENCLYLLLPNGVARTKLTNAWLDSKLGVVSTMRNWTTATKLLAMANDKYTQAVR